MAVPHRRKKNRLVKRPISRSSASAMKALTKPIRMASPEMVRARERHGEIAQLILGVVKCRRFAFCGHPYLS